MEKKDKIFVTQKKTLLWYFDKQCTVFRHADKPIPENRGLNGTSGSNNSYDDNLAHN